MVESMDLWMRQINIQIHLNLQKKDSLNERYYWYSLLLQQISSICICYLFTWQNSKKNQRKKSKKERSTKQDYADA